MVTNNEGRASITILAAAFLLSVSTSPGFGQETRSKIRISYPNISICCLALFAAQQWKIFEQNGLDVESIQMRSQAANSALASSSGWTPDGKPRVMCKGKLSTEYKSIKRDTSSRSRQ